MRGVAYQQEYSTNSSSSGQDGGHYKDPLADVDGCKRDIEEFKKLGINTVRVYTVDNSADHDECMSMLADAGIYLALDASTPDYSLNRESLETLHQSYNAEYLQHLFSTIDAFAGYSE